MRDQGKLKFGTQVYNYITRTIFKQNHVGSKSCLKLSIVNP